MVTSKGAAANSPLNSLSRTSHHSPTQRSPSKISGSALVGWVGDKYERRCSRSQTRHGLWSGFLRKLPSGASSSNTRPAQENRWSKVACGLGGAWVARCPAPKPKFRILNHGGHCHEGGGEPCPSFFDPSKTSRFMVVYCVFVHLLKQSWMPICCSG